MQRVHPDDQVEEGAEVARGDGQAVADQRHPLDALEDHEEGAQQHRRQQRAARSLAVARERPLRQVEAHPGRQQRAGVEERLLDREARLVGRRPDQRRRLDDREGADHPGEHHRLDRHEDEHAHHPVRNERDALGLGCDAQATGSADDHGLPPR